MNAMSRQSEAAIQEANLEQGLVLFDGVCHLCQAGVRWVMHRDTQERFVFASLQDPGVQRVLASYGCEVAIEGELTTMVVIAGQKALTHSDAALAVARGLPGLWSPCARIGGWLPKWLRDGVYRLVAKHRYRLFGRSDVCWIPDASAANRMVHADGLADWAKAPNDA